MAAPVLIVCVMKQACRMPANALGGAIVTERAEIACGSVERSVGREIERDPPRRGASPNRGCPKLNPIG
jgi:hypothetical protein